HHLESYLGLVRKGPVNLTAAGVEALLDGARVLEAIVAARRDGRPAPATEVLLTRFAALVPGPREAGSPAAAGDEPGAAEPAAAALPADKRARLDAAVRPGGRAGRGRGAAAP